MAPVPGHRPRTVADFNALSVDHLAGHLGIVVLDATFGRTHLELEIKPFHMAGNGYLHAGAVVTLADTACGYGCVATLPDNAIGFTTIELKSNHLSTARDGVLDCIATSTHTGGTTQVWDAVVTSRTTGKTVAIFRCTQMVLYPRA